MNTVAVSESLRLLDGDGGTGTGVAGAGLVGITDTVGGVASAALASNMSATR